MAVCGPYEPDGGIHEVAVLCFVPCIGVLGRVHAESACRRHGQGHGHGVPDGEAVAGRAGAGARSGGAGTADPH